MRAYNGEYAYASLLVLHSCISVFVNDLFLIPPVQVFSVNAANNSHQLYTSCDEGILFIVVGTTMNMFIGNT